MRTDCGGRRPDAYVPTGRALLARARENWPRRGDLEYFCTGTGKWLDFGLWSIQLKQFSKPRVPSERFALKHERAEAHPGPAA